MSARENSIVRHVNAYMMVCVRDREVCVVSIYTYMYCIERSVNISITRITRVNDKYFCYVAISDDICTHADFQVDGYLGY